jgi:hypothetical protein
MTIIGKPVYSDELLHYQVKGAKWGVRRWQNLDGSLTPEGRIHYGIGPARDKDPDLVDPVKTANADVERLSKAYDRWQTASDDVRRYAKESNARRKLFEKKSDYNERINTAKMRLDLAEVEEIDSSNEFDDARDAAQARFEKYMRIADELESDMDWIDMHMILETDETGSKQTYKDRDEMDRQWSALIDAVDTYWYHGLTNHDRAMNANDEYRDKFEMNDSPRGKEAAREKTAKFAIRNVKTSGTGEDVYASIKKSLTEGRTQKGNSISFLKDIDTGSLSLDYRTVGGMTNKELIKEYNDSIDHTANKIAEKLLKGFAKETISPGVTAKDYVAEYVRQKAFADSIDDPDELTDWYGWGAFGYYDPTERIKQLKKQQKS